MKEEERLKPVDAIGKKKKKKSFYRGGRVRVVAVDQKAGQEAHNQGFQQVKERLARRK